MPESQSWLLWALLSAVFAAATAILAKIGLEGIDSDYATLVRTTVILVVLGGFDRSSSSPSPAWPPARAGSVTSGRSSWARRIASPPEARSRR